MNHAVCAAVVTRRFLDQRSKRCVASNHGARGWLGTLEAADCSLNHLLQPSVEPRCLDRRRCCVVRHTNDQPHGVGRTAVRTRRGHCGANAQPAPGSRVDAGCNSPAPGHRRLAKRCRATSKRLGKPCQSPAVRGWCVCRMHGAGGGAPRGNRNALKHGRYTAEAIADRRWLRELLQDCQELLERF
jgi:hypothetical protein